MNEKEKNEVIPVILGADLGAYCLARSFAELGCETSHIFARDKLAITGTSSYIEYHLIRELCDCNHAVPALLNFAKENQGCEKLLLVPAADWYMEMLQYAADALRGHFYFHIPRFEIWRTVSDKASFLYILDLYKIPHPKTEIFDESLTDFSKKCSHMKPPFVVKPSDSSEYYRNKFDGMKKVYFALSLDEARRIAERIFASGYGGKVLVQEYIGSERDKAGASVLTVYLDSSAKAKRAVLGDVLLEETEDSARGNYSAIVTRPLDEISYRIITMLEGIGYTGIANFDILHDGSGSYCLELNPRQGRSFDYIRGAGVSIAELLSGEAEGAVVDECFVYDEYLWLATSFSTVAKYATAKDLLSKAERLMKMGKIYTPYDSSRDSGFLRRLYVKLHLARYDKRFFRESKRGGLECFFRRSSEN